ncbi:ATP-binding protein [Bowmanella dokdonensis]|uniref:histidine kinase n=1 Tax=Bowmanella dokdonensis TaxID=751969 RepID=A0A939DLR4_9ALTE|nr:ATP-binding protein [Bowmanella dokdonensis]MBN7824607.1 GHKL domain-containing protein [Bowmanella dokdonensis]
MQKWTLKRRSFVAALLVLVVFLPLTALTLEQAFTNSLSQSMQDQLRIQNLGLISEFEVVGGEIQMPEQLFNENLNIPDSGTYAIVSMHMLPLWQSASTLHWQKLPDLQRPSVGEELFLSKQINGRTYFQFSYTAEFEDIGFMFPVTFHILQEGRLFDSELSAFRNTLWQWLLLVALVLIAVLSFSLSAALNPIGLLVKQIGEVESDRQDRVTGKFPPELERLKASLNHLLDSEQQQRKRYHNSLGDLAHNLKTPLAVLKGQLKLDDAAREPLGQIESIIARQLKRAVAGSGSGWQQAMPLAPILDKLIRAMHKVYADKQLQIELEDPDNLSLSADETDLMELFGNLLDNACKAARRRVRIRLIQQPNKSQVNIEDDGPGIPPAQREALLARGIRLDTYTSGQGIGMAVVSDLVSAYQGRLQIRDSEFGGALISLSFAHSV